MSPVKPRKTSLPKTSSLTDQATGYQTLHLGMIRQAGYCPQF